jgi:GGDEF domain-containing protein
MLDEMSESETGQPWLADMSASFGCASCPEDASDAQTLFRLADEALYEAKRAGDSIRFVARA